MSDFTLPFFIITAFLHPLVNPAQDRDTLIRRDSATFQDSESWLYNDLEKAFTAAREAERPLMVVVRCIPCDACQEFDDDVARRDPIIRDLMDQFVCVRLTKANDLDLNRFQFDYDQSMAILFFQPDGTLLARYGTRSARHETEDISLHGLRETMSAVLRLRNTFENVREALAAKQPVPSAFARPIDYPSLAGRYEAELSMEGPIARSCVHCHQIGDAQRELFRARGEPIPDEVLFPYPDPATLGLEIDPRSLLEIERVEPDSIADRAGLRIGDRLAKLEGQPLVSTADLQWVLHRTPSEAARLDYEAVRDGALVTGTFDLPEDWRRRGDLSWRVTSWQLRRMGLGGLKLKPLEASRRDEFGLSSDQTALEVAHVGQYGDHARAKRAGFKHGDVIVEFDGRTDFQTETDVLAYTVQEKQAGDRVSIDVLRGDERLTLSFTLQ